MSEDLKAFCAAMDGRWVVESHTRADDGSGRVEVTYRSLNNQTLTWTHRPFHPEAVAPIGTVGRIGFIGRVG